MGKIKDIVTAKAEDVATIANISFDAATTAVMDCSNPLTASAEEIIAEMDVPEDIKLARKSVAVFRDGMDAATLAEDYDEAGLLQDIVDSMEDYLTRHDPDFIREMGRQNDTEFETLYGEQA